LLMQDVFAGVGNIIKNEVLYRIHVHPLSTVGMLPPRKLSALIREARNYCFDFYEWKKRYELRKHWLAHGQKICRRCNLPMKRTHLGRFNRRTFFCEGCQILFS
jgi:endonuclease-8